MLQIRWLLVWAGYLVWAVPGLADTPPTIMYRVDVRDPYAAWIFQQGFRAWGQDTDLIAHVTGSSIRNHSSAFVSVTDHRAAAEQIAMARLLQGNPSVWIYEVRATEAFYEVNASLRQAILQLAVRDGHGSVQMTNLESIETLYGHQYEWVTPQPIPSTSIRSAQAYRLQAQPSQSDVAPQMEEEPHTLLFNPNYRDAPSHANHAVWPIVPPQVAEPPMYSLRSGLRAVGLSWCAVAMGSTATRLTRRSIAFDYREPIPEPDCSAAQISAVPQRALVWDDTLMRLVKRPVPWVTLKRESSGHQTTVPINCMVQPGDDLKDTLMIHCQDNPDYSHYVVRARASGAVYKWIDAGYKGARTGRPWWGLASAMPVHNTKWMLSDYHYSIFDVFASTSGGWYSQLLVAPYYPDLTYAGRKKRSSEELSVTPAFTPVTFPAQDYLRQQLNQLPPMRK